MKPVGWVRCVEGRKRLDGERFSRRTGIRGKTLPKPKKTLCKGIAKIMPAPISGVLAFSPFSIEKKKNAKTFTTFTRRRPLWQYGKRF